MAIRAPALLNKFVCVRIVSTNGLDLSLFQFDTDQSFAAFLLNADRTIYGRFGTRSHRTSWSDDLSIEGLAKALRGALDLHAQYPKNKAVLAGKNGRKPRQRLTAPRVCWPVQAATRYSSNACNRWKPIGTWLRPWSWSDSSE